MVSLPGDASYASLLTNRLSQATVGCLMLAYSFSPRVHSIPRGSRKKPRRTKYLAWDKFVYKIVLKILSSDNVVDGNVEKIRKFHQHNNVGKAVARFVLCNR